MSEQLEFNRLKDCRHGRMLFNVNDVYIGRSLDLYGEFSEGEVELFRQIVKPGHIVLDLGANIGVHTVPLARLTGPQGAVLAFEPQRLVFQTLCANVALNSFTNVWCFNAAAGDVPGTVHVPALNPTVQNNFGGLGLLGRSQGEPVQQLRIDDLPIGRCTFMKIDVEGMETQVIQGARNTIGRCQPIMYVENDRAEHSAELVRLIDSLGYDMYWHKPPLFNPANFFHNNQNVFGNIISGNMLCLPKAAPRNLAGFQRVDVPV